MENNNNSAEPINEDIEDEDKIKTEYLTLKRKFEELQSERENYKKQLLAFEAESRKWKKKASEVYSSK
jgi:predicted  nucleic acid-binding Zn-ribbon protein